MSVRYRLPLAGLGLACALAAGCSNPCCPAANPCCPGSAMTQNQLPQPHQHCVHCRNGCPASPDAGPATVQMADAPPPPDDAATCPTPSASCPPAACPPVAEKRKHKHKHVARRTRRSAEPPVENVVVQGPESQFVPVPSRPVFGPRYDPRSADDSTPAPAPIDVQPQPLPIPQARPRRRRTTLHRGQPAPAPPVSRRLRKMPI